MGKRQAKKNANGSGTDARKRKDGRHETRATLNTPTGRKRVSFYGKTSEEANNAKFQALADQAKGLLFNDPGKLTVAEYLQRWLSDTVKYEVAASTFSHYERTVRNHFLPFFGRLRLRDVTPAHIRALKAKKLKDGMHPNTVGVVQGVLSGALNQAVYDGLIAQNPCAKVKKAAARGKKPMRSLTKKEANALVWAATGTRDEALIVMALRTGMRQGELAALRWEDLDLGDKVGSEGGAHPSVTVRNSADTRTKTVITPTKTGEERTLKLGPRMVEALKAHRARQREERMAASVWEDAGWVFPNRRGKVRRRDSVMRVFRKMLAEAELPSNIRFHDLRHTAGTLAIKQGRPIPAVSKMLGHSDPAMTLRRYAHVLEEMEDDTAQAMDDLF